jgi:hypothetical protein
LNGNKNFNKKQQKNTVASQPQKHYAAQSDTLSERHKKEMEKPMAHTTDNSIKQFGKNKQELINVLADTKAVLKDAIAALTTHGR